MSRKGDCWDNAVAESFFATLRAESRLAAQRAIGEYTDGFCNLRRRHSTIDYLSPTDFELKTRTLKKRRIKIVHAAGKFQRQAIHHERRPRA